MGNEEALWGRQLHVESSLDRFLNNLGYDCWGSVPADQHEILRNALVGVGYMIKPNGILEPIHNSATFTSIHSSEE